MLKYIVCLCKGYDRCCVFIAMRGAVGASCGSSQCCILNELQFVNAGRGCKKRPYGRGILQSRSHDCLIGNHEGLLLFTPSCYCEGFYQLYWLVLRCYECVRCMRVLGLM